MTDDAFLRRKCGGAVVTVVVLATSTIMRNEVGVRFEVRGVRCEV